MFKVSHPKPHVVVAAELRLPVLLLLGTLRLLLFLLSSRIMITTANATRRPSTATLLQEPQGLLTQFFLSLTRCERLNLDCHPQNHPSRARLRRLEKLRSEKAAASFSTGGDTKMEAGHDYAMATVGYARPIMGFGGGDGGGSSSSSSNDPGRGTFHTLEGPSPSFLSREDERVDNQVLASPITLQPPIPLIQTYQAAAQAIYQSLASMKAEGRINCGRILSMVKAWEHYNRRNSLDVTMGLVGMIVRLIGFHEADLGTIGDPNARPIQHLEEEDVRDGLGHPLPYYIAKVSAVPSGMMRLID